jgi:amyloid beta precursor protein binding protein 1
VSKLLSESGTPVSVGDDYVQEMTRYGAAELHSVAAFVGGCAAHEAIKILTRQYVPVDNTVVYNAMQSKCASFKM